MHIDFGRKLRNLKGIPLKSEDETSIDLKFAAVTALLGSYPDEQGLAGLEKYARFKLADRIQNAKGTVEVTTEEVTKIKTLIGKAFSPLLVGAAYDVIEGVNKPEPETETQPAPVADPAFNTNEAQELG